MAVPATMEGEHNPIQIGFVKTIGLTDQLDTSDAHSRHFRLVATVRFFLNVRRYLQNVQHETNAYPYRATVGAMVAFGLQGNSQTMKSCATKPFRGPP